MSGCKIVFVRNLGPNTSALEIALALYSYGRIISIELAVDGMDNRTGEYVLHL